MLEGEKRWDGLTEPQELGRGRKRSEGDRGARATTAASFLQEAARTFHGGWAEIARPYGLAGRVTRH